MFTNLEQSDSLSEMRNKVVTEYVNIGERPAGFSSSRSVDSLDDPSDPISSSPSPSSLSPTHPQVQSASFARNLGTLRSQRGSNPLIETLDTAAAKFIGSPNFVSTVIGHVTDPPIYLDDTKEDDQPPSSSLLRSFINCSHQANHQHHESLVEKMNQIKKAPFLVQALSRLTSAGPRGVAENVADELTAKFAGITKGQVFGEIADWITAHDDAMHREGIVLNEPMTNELLPMPLRISTLINYYVPSKLMQVRRKEKKKQELRANGARRTQVDYAQDDYAQLNLNTRRRSLFLPPPFVHTCVWLLF